MNFEQRQEVLQLQILMSESLRAGKEAISALKAVPDLAKEIHGECYSCVHRRTVPGETHIACVKPDAAMVGSLYGIQKGWFVYPMLFDPVWKERLCANFESTESVSLAISQPVSRETD